MTLTKDKIQEALDIHFGKQRPFSDADIKWANEVIKEAFLNGYKIYMELPQKAE